MCDSLNDFEEEHSKKENSIRKKQIVITSIQEKRWKEKHDNLEDDEKGRLRRYKKKRRNVTHNNLDNEEKEHWKKEGTIGGYDNLGDNKKGQLRRKCEKKKRNSCENLE